LVNECVRKKTLHLPITKTKRMDISTKVGTASGAIVGFVKWFISIDSTFLLRLAESGFAALFSGAMASLGSYLMVRWIKSKYKQNGKHKSEN
jgi:hypothetical protein